MGEKFRDDGRLWETQDVNYNQGLDRYLVDYHPARLTVRSSAQDKAGYETRIEEVFEWLGKARLRQLGLLTNQEYWDALKGSGVAVYIDGNGRPRRVVHDPAIPRLLHEARAAIGPVAIPVEVVYDSGHVDVHVLHFDGRNISRIGPESAMYSNKSLDACLKRMACDWCSDRVAARSAAVRTGKNVRVIYHPRYANTLLLNC